MSLEAQKRTYGHGQNLFMTVMTSVITAVIVYSLTFAGTQMLKTEKQEIEFNSISKRIVSLENRMSIADRNQNEIFIRLENIAVSMNGIKDTVIDIKRDVKSVTYKAGVLKNRTQLENEN